MIRLRSLGECTIEVGDTRLGPQQEIAFGLALLLSCERGRAVARQEILDLLWPRVSRERASHCLRQTHYRLRSLGIPTEATKASIVLPDGTIVRDLDEWLSSTYEERLTNPHVGHGVLPQYEPTFSEGFAEYVERHRTRANAQIRQRLVEDLEIARSMHKWGDVDLLSRLLLQLDPLHEAATLALAEATARTGARREAVTILDGYIREVGSGDEVLTRPALALRRRISEYTPPVPVTAPADQCFVGRGREVASLLAMVQRAAEGSGGAVWVSGPAGIGKTRLVQEVLTSARFRGVRTLQLALRPIDQHHPLSGAAQLAAGVLKMRGALGCSPESLSCLSSLNIGNTEATDQETGVAATRLPALRSAFVDALDALSGEAAHVIALDDVQWLDTLSWSLVSSLMRWAADQRMLLILISRPFPDEAEHARHVAGEVTFLHLSPLERDASTELFSHATSLARRAPEPAHVEWCLSLAQGNPLYLKALGAHWLATATPFSLPPSLSEILEARVRLLSDTARLVLQTCSVLARHSTLTRIERALEIPAHELCTSLVELERAGMLSADGSLQPRHELIAEAALRDLPKTSRHFLHRRAALVLEEDLTDTEYSPALWDVAHHWTAANDPARVVPAALRCAGHLVNIGFPAEAAEILTRTFQYCVDLRQQFQLLAARARALYLAGRLSAVIQAIEEGRQVGSALQPSGEWHSDLEFLELEARWRQNESMRDLLARAMACVLDPAATREHRLGAARWALIFADNLGQADDARSIYDSARHIAGSDLSASPDWCTIQLIYHASFGDLDCATTAADDLVRVRRNGDSPADLARALRYAAVVLYPAGRVAEAEAALLESLDIARRYRLSDSAASSAEYLANRALQAGRIEDAKRWVEIAEDWLSFHSHHNATVEDLCNVRARIALAEGDARRAADLASYALSDILLDPIETRREQRLSFFVRLRLALHLPIDDSARCALEAIVTKRLGRLVEDGPVFALALAMCAASQHARANALVREYALVHRRDRRPLPPALAQLQTITEDANLDAIGRGELLGMEH